MATYSNGTMTMIGDGGRLFHPIIAVESYCNLGFDGCASQSHRTVTVGDNSVTVTIGSDGKANVSLLPFIRNDIKSRSVQESPFTRSWRGSLSVQISSADSSAVATTITIFYIFGYFHASNAMDSDVWLTYNSAAGDYNVVGVDWGDHYTNGVPNDLGTFRGIGSDPSEWVSPPTEGSVFTFQVQQVAAGRIYNDDRNFHFALDCRDEGIVQLRWIDADGYPNTRKFALSLEQNGAAVSNTYRILHKEHAIVNNTYDFGRDEWGDIEAQHTLTIGDDAIPQNQWAWLKGLVTSQCVEMYDGGVWRRVNISSPSMERDPRKHTFNFSITIVVFADEIQEF